MYIKKVINKKKFFLNPYNFSLSLSLSLSLMRQKKETNKMYKTQCSPVTNIIKENEARERVRDSRENPKGE
jgi:hypothetical protein